MVERKQEKQCIDKLWNLKDLYKKAKENNCTSGASPESSFFFQRFPWDTLREENKLERKECGIKDCELDLQNRKNCGIKDCEWTKYSLNCRIKECEEGFLGWK